MLASKWPNDDNEGVGRDFKIHAEAQVERDDHTAEGVFPGNKNRTPIAKLDYIGEPPY